MIYDMSGGYIDRELFYYRELYYYAVPFFSDTELGSLIQSSDTE